MFFAIELFLTFASYQFFKNLLNFNKPKLIFSRETFPTTLLIPILKIFVSK